MTPLACPYVLSQARRHYNRKATTFRLWLYSLYPILTNSFGYRNAKLCNSGFWDRGGTLGTGTFDPRIKGQMYLSPMSLQNQYALTLPINHFAALYMGFSRTFDAAFSSFRISICCGQCVSHLPHWMHFEASHVSFLSPVHIRYSLTAENQPSEYLLL